MQKRVAFWGLASVLAGLILPLFAISPAHAADRVGVAAAVKPDATSQPPGGAMRTLTIGKSVVYNERIDTSASGVVQVLLVDGSTFTVGPQSSLVIDKFVYEPARGKGELVATFSKGALRFVGGKLSKDPKGIAIKTPAGGLTVRGGITQGFVYGPNRALFAFVFGDYLSLRRNGRLYTLRNTGTVFAISGPGAPTIRPVTAADTSRILAAVSGQKIKTATQATYKKGRRWPYYYGIQPAGKYPDQPFVKELSYDTATGDRIRGMKPPPVPAIVQPPPIVIQPTPVVEQPTPIAQPPAPPPVAPDPLPPPQVTPTPPVIVPINPTCGPACIR